MEWSTALPDWERRIVDGESLIGFPPLFPAEADAALEVLRALRIVDAVGSPTFGESSRAWFLDWAAALFGSYDPESGRRLIREYLLLISKKNGKSTAAAALMLTALIRNWRPSAEYYIIAPTIEAANNSFFPARDMVRANEELIEILDVREHMRTITHRTTGAFLKVVAAESDTVSGKKAVGVLVDELWLFGKRANAASMLAEATGGLVSRPEGFVIYLSTQSDEAPAGVFAQKLSYFRQVRDGEINDQRSLPVLYEFPKAMIEARAYLDPANFHITNPNLGLSVDEEWLRDGLQRAIAEGDAARNVFLAKHLNIEIGLALLSDHWPGARYWEKNADPSLTLAALIERSDVIALGVDGGGLDDLLGLAVLGRDRGTGHWLHWGRAWAHRDVLERRKEIAPRLLDFEADGDLVLVPLMGDAFDDLVDIAEQIFESGKLAQIGLDPAGIKEIVTRLTQRGMSEDGGQLIGVRQGWSLSGTIKGVEQKLADGEMRHCGQRLLSWSMGNAKMKVTGSNMLITKQASGVAKIDPVLAIFDAADCLSRAEEGPSVYESRGFLVI